MKVRDQKETETLDERKNLSEVDVARRLFSKRGLIALPIITLANRSAWANNCVFSGFQSFAVAGRLGQNLSHGAFTPPEGSGWKSPSAWFSHVNSTPGLAWPQPYIPTRKKPNGKYQILNPLTGIWSGNYFSNSPNIAKGFVSSLVTSSSDSRTIYTALYENSANDKILLYQIATEFNKLVSTVAFPNLTGEILTSNNVSKTDYEWFYDSCIE